MPHYFWPSINMHSRARNAHVGGRVGPRVEAWTPRCGQQPLAPLVAAGKFPPGQAGSRPGQARRDACAPRHCHRGEGIGAEAPCAPRHATPSCAARVWAQIARNEHSFRLGSSDVRAVPAWLAGWLGGRDGPAGCGPRRAPQLEADTGPWQPMVGHGVCGGSGNVGSVVEP